MTLKEKVAEVNPEYIDEHKIGGVERCPSDYSYLNKPELNYVECGEEDCEKCWNQTYVEKSVETVDKSDNTDNVNHPSHYAGKRECIEEMRLMFGDEAVKAFCKCNAYKYQFRAGKKEGNSAEQDRAKADWYIDYLEKMMGE